MPDKLALYNQACIHIGKATLSNLTDDVEARYVLDDAWQDVMLDVFNAGDFNAFKASVKLIQSVSGTAAVGWEYVFDYPSDYSRTVAVSNIPAFNDPFFDYVDQGGYLHANTTEIYLRYISDAKASDSGVAMWPDMVWRYAALVLARNSCVKLTGSSTREAEIDGMVTKALRRAKSVDARNENNKRPATGSWLRSRRGYGVGGNGVGNVIVGGEIVLGEGDV